MATRVFSPQIGAGTCPLQGRHGECNFDDSESTTSTPSSPDYAGAPVTNPVEARGDGNEDEVELLGSKNVEPPLNAWREDPVSLDE